jgi:hypothetical protein
MNIPDDVGHGDPKMKAALEQIMAIIKANDLAGAVFLQSAYDLEYKIEISPSWSCAVFTPPDATGRSGIRFRAMGTDFATKEEQKKSVEATTGMMMAFQNQFSHWNENFLRLLSMLGQHFKGGIDHWEKRR